MKAKKFNAQSGGRIGSGDRCKPSLGASAPGILPSELRLNLSDPLTFKLGVDVDLKAI
jgi:hypothetical protein